MYEVGMGEPSLTNSTFDHLSTSVGFTCIIIQNVINYDYHHCRQLHYTIVCCSVQKLLVRHCRTLSSWNYNYDYELETCAECFLNRLSTLKKFPPPPLDHTILSLTHSSPASSCPSPAPFPRHYFPYTNSAYNE